MSQPHDSVTARATTPALLTIALAAAGYSILYRLAPAYAAPNLSPIGALCLFSLGFLPVRWAALVPLAVMVVSDLVLYRWYGYAMALPFYRNTLLGDALFTALFFGLAFAAERSRVAKPVDSPV